jgi:hypothetical protein
MIHQVTWSDKLGRHTASLDGLTSKDAAIKIAYALRSMDATCNSRVMEVVHAKGGVVFRAVFPKVGPLPECYPEPTTPDIRPAA